MHPRAFDSPLRGAILVGTIVTLAFFPGSVSAQGYFGKNKITYDHRDWRELRTEHAEVYFYPEEEGLARQVAAIAESTCIELDATFRMRPRKRIPILFYSSHQAFQQSNAASGFIGEGTGGLTELIKGRVLIPHTGSHHRLVWVTRHELVHAYMLEKLAQVGKDAKKYRMFFPPLWFTEGLAEFLSTSWDSQAEGLLQDAMVTGEALPLTQSEAITGSVLMYKEGQSFLDYVAEHHGGKSKVMDMFENWSKGENFEDVFEITFGVKLEEVDQAWYTAMRRRYYPRIETRRPVGEIARRLTCCNDAYNVAPCVLPNAPGDSTMLRFAYLRADEGAVDLRLREEKRGKILKDERILRSGFSSRFESFHFFRSRLGASRDDRLALVAQDGGADVLHVVDLESKKVLQTWSFPGIVGLASPTWVAGDSSIVVVGQAVSGHTDLYEVRVSDGKLRQLTNDSSDEDDPVAHPTKALIAFASDREGGVHGRAHLFTYDLASGTLAQITSGEHNERRPEWSPDGERLAFVSDREGIDDLYLWDEGRVQRASRFLGPITDPTWRRDGKALLFAGQSGWSYHVYEIGLAPVDSLWIAEPVDSNRLGVPVAISATEPAERYRPSYSLDIAQSIVSVDPSMGTTGGGGGMVALSDVLGNQGYSMFLSNDASSLGTLLDGMELGVTYFNRAQRMNYGFGVFRLTRTYDADFDVVRRERRVGLTGMASYPISKFERIEVSTVLRYSQGHYLRNGNFQDLWLMSNYLGLVHDDARHTPWGPASGTRMNVTGGFTRDHSTGQGDYLSLSAEVRRYTPLAREVVWANRAGVQASFGDNRESYYLGGSSSLRAYPRRVMSGPKVLMLQTELRFPILRGMRMGFPLPMAFPRVNATLSAEMATAGESGERFARLGTVGAGLFVGGGWFPVLRVDWLKRTDLKRIEAPTYTRFTMGYLF